VKTYPFDGIPLLLCYADRLGARRQLGIVSNIFGQQLEKLFLILSNELSELRVSSSDLLEDRL
jgi:hypothetical protein